jgi:U4/U6.U5 tri-snRNP-associated protein 1
MASGDTPLNTNAAFQMRQAKLGSATMVLSVGNKGYVRGFRLPHLFPPPSPHLLRSRISAHRLSRAAPQQEDAFLANLRSNPAQAKTKGKAKAATAVPSEVNLTPTLVASPSQHAISEGPNERSASPSTRGFAPVRSSSTSAGTFQPASVRSAARAAHAGNSGAASPSAGGSGIRIGLGAGKRKADGEAEGTPPRKK